MSNLSKSFIISAFLVVVFTLVVILPPLISGKTFYGIDGNVGVIRNVSEALWRLENEHWNFNYLLGLPLGVSFNLPIFFGKIIGYERVPIFDIALYIVVSFIGMYIFLRSSGLTMWGALFGAVSISLTTMGVLSVLGGHIIGSLGFLLLALGIVKYVYSKEHGIFKLSLLVIIAGVSIGLAFADFQRTIYFGIVLGAYIIFLSLIRFNRISEILKINWNTLLKLILVPLSIFVVFVAFSFVSIKGMFGFAQMQQIGSVEGDPESKWRFLVQFSYPPEEILNFFVPGLFGYFSNDPELPYWGRAAQDFGYEATKQGMRNFRLGIDAYANVFVLPFVILALLYFRNWERERKLHFVFWAVVAIISFLFSIARYFPTPFYLLTQIPYFDKLRVPAKWMDIFTISLVIMSAFSIDSFVKGVGNGTKENRLFLSILLVYSGVLFLSYLILSGVKAEITMHFAYQHQYDYSIASRISENIISSVGTSFLFVIAGTLLLYVLEKVVGVRVKPEEKAFGRSLVFDTTFVVFLLMVFVNMFVTVKPLFKEVDPSKLYKETEVVRFMKDKLKEEQARVVMYSGFANHYFTFLFPYHKLETIQSIAASRLPDEYIKLLPIINSFNFDVMAKYGTKYFLTELPPSHPVFLQVPILKYYTNLYCSIYLSEDQQSVSNFFYVYEVTNSLPRFFITPNYIKYNGQIEMILMLPIEVLKNSVLLTNDITNFSPSHNLQHDISVLEYSGNYAKLKVFVSDKCFLVFNNYYHPKWECLVNGKKKEILKANYLAQAVYFDSQGEYIVEFKFNSFSVFSLIQMFLLICFFGALGLVGLRF
ncbi:MAG: hypothetical protein ABDH28_06095 [Brevinematia bacterium]